MIGTVRAVLAKRAPELGQHEHDRLVPGWTHLIGESRQALPQADEQIRQLPLRVALVDVRIPAADVDEPDVELILHEPRHAARLELEALRGERVPIRRLHLARHAALRHHVGLFGDRLPQVEAFRDERLKTRARVHLREQRHLPIVKRRLAGAFERDVRHDDLPAHHHRQPIGERYRRGASVERGGQAIEKPGSVCARDTAGRRHRHSALHAVLCLEVTACEILRAVEGHERELPFCQRGSMESLSAGCKPHVTASFGRASEIAALGFPGSGFGSAMVGRTS